MSFAAFVTVGFLVLMFANRNTFFGTLRTSQLLENSLLRVLSRLSFSFYLIHMTVLKTIYANLHEAERGTALLAVRFVNCILFRRLLISKKLSVSGTLVSHGYNVLPVIAGFPLD